VIIKPDLMNGLAWAQATHESPYGTISSAWQVSGSAASLNITIPPGATARVYLPMLGTTLTNVTIQESGTILWQNGAAANADPGVAFLDFEGGAAQSYAVWSVASGSYQFGWQVMAQAPTGLAAAPGNEQVSLSWNAVAGATGYQIQRTLSSGSNYTTVATVSANSYIDTGLANGTNYFYVVSALSPGGASAASAEAGAAPLLSLNLGFEIPVVSDYQYAPTGGYWAFTGASGNGSGLIANGSGFSNPNAPEGVQAAFVQAHGTVSQVISGFIPGTNYTITFSAAQRPPGNQNGGESWNVTIDGTTIKSFNPGAAATSYINYTASFTATTNAHTLAFVGTDIATGDNTVFIDNVRFSPAIQPVSASVALTGPTDGAAFVVPGSVALAATVTTNSEHINNVQFFADVTNLLGQDATAPYGYAWTNVSAGNHTVRARVNFNGNRYADSAPINIVVATAPPTIQSVTAGMGSFSLAGVGQPQQAYVLMTASNLTPPVAWAPFLTNQSDGSGNFMFTNLLTTNSQQFFRISAP
jgi:hypothetical protein